jgi:hypothetical protein
MHLIEHLLFLPGNLFCRKVLCFEDLVLPPLAFEEFRVAI